MKRKALLMCLSDRARDEKIVLIDKLEMDGFKTKKFLEILNNLPNKEKKTLLVLTNNDKKVIKSAANLPYVETTEARGLNVADVLNHNYLMIPVESLRAVEKNLKK